MHIIVIRHSIRNRGGDRLVLDYLDHLVRKDHEVSYWTNEVNTHFSINPAIDIKQIPFKGIGGTVLFTLFNRFRGDIILVDLIVMALFACLRNRNKTVCLAQDWDVTYHKNIFLKCFINVAYKLVLNALKVPTIAVSEGLARILMKYQPKRLACVQNGVDLNVYKRNQKSHYLTQRQKPYIIGLFAREDRRKGLDIGIETLRLLKGLRPASDWEVWVIGSPKVSLEGVSVKHLGFIANDDDLRDVLSAMDIYLVPSRSEGLSLLLLQALACQCVIVSTAASSIIEHEVNGLISPIEDSQALAANVSRVISDQGLFQKLKENARYLAQNYSIEKSKEQFEKTIKGIKNGKSINDIS